MEFQNMSDKMPDTLPGGKWKDLSEYMSNKVCQLNMPEIMSKEMPGTIRCGMSEHVWVYVRPNVGNMFKRNIRQKPDKKSDRKAES